MLCLLCDPRALEVGLQGWEGQHLRFPFKHCRGRVIISIAMIKPLLYKSLILRLNFGVNKLANSFWVPKIVNSVSVCLDLALQTHKVAIRHTACCHHVAKANCHFANQFMSTCMWTTCKTFKQNHCNWQLLKWVLLWGSQELHWWRYLLAQYCYIRNYNYLDWNNEDGPSIPN